jgi:hypothetical protein
VDPQTALEPVPTAAVDARKPSVPAFEDLDPSTVEVRLDRSGCYGWCPDYSIVIAGDGTVRYTGRSYVQAVGEREYHIPREALRDLVALCERQKFFELKLNCSVIVTDVPSTVLRLKLGDRARVIENRWGGSESGFPEEDEHMAVHQLLDDLAYAVDRAVNVEQWIGSEEERKRLFERSRDGLPVQSAPR